MAVMLAGMKTLKKRKMVNEELNKSFGLKASSKTPVEQFFGRGKLMGLGMTSQQIKDELRSAW